MKTFKNICLVKNVLQIKHNIYYVGTYCIKWLHFLTINICTLSYQNVIQESCILRLNND